MCLCQTELSPGILLEERIKPNILVFSWPREWYQCRKPPAGCLFVSGFLKAVHIMAPGIVLSYFHQKCGSERGQAGINGHDCTSLSPVSQYISLFPTSCTLKMCYLLLLLSGDLWKMQQPWHTWEMWWVYKWVSPSITSTLFDAASSKWPHHSLRSGSAVSLLLSVTPCLPSCGRDVLPCVTGLTCEKNGHVSLASAADLLCYFRRVGECKNCSGGGCGWESLYADISFVRNFSIYRDRAAELGFWC